MELSKEVVAKNVKKAREIKSQAIGSKYTQKMLAADAGISQGYLGDIEAGRTLPSRDAALKIATVTGTSIDLILGTESKVNNPTALQEIKNSFSQMLDIVYLPVVGHIPAGKPLLVEENIEKYLPYPKEYDPNRHFVLRVQGDSMKDAGIHNGDMVVIRKQPVAENGQIVAVRLKDDGVTLKKIYFEDGKVLLKPCNPDFQPMELSDNVEVIGIAVSITKKLA